MKIFRSFPVNLIIWFSKFFLIYLTGKAKIV